MTTLTVVAVLLVTVSVAGFVRNRARLSEGALGSAVPNLLLGATFALLSAFSQEPTARVIMACIGGMWLQEWLRPWPTAERHTDAPRP